MTSDRSRRRFLRRASALAAGTVLPLAARAEWGKVHEIAGQVLLNGSPMGLNSAVSAGQTITTGADGRVWFTVAGDAFFLRPGSELRLRPSPGRDTVIEALRLVSGALGATFGRVEGRSVIAHAVTIGLRGTGIYVETTPQETYACTCFGATELFSASSGAMVASIAVVAEHHVARRIARETIAHAPFERHTSEEMARLERLAGRPNPFQR